eukprot:5291692-Pleurochrysis_carterae.AAC.1
MLASRNERLCLLLGTSACAGIFACVCRYVLWLRVAAERAALLVPLCRQQGLSMGGMEGMMGGIGGMAGFGAGDDPDEWKVR